MIKQAERTLSNLPKEIASKWRGWNSNYVWVQSSQNILLHAFDFLIAPDISI